MQSGVIGASFKPKYTYNKQVAPITVTNVNFPSQKFYGHRLFRHGCRLFRHGRRLFRHGPLNASWYTVTLTFLHLGADYNSWYTVTLTYNSWYTITLTWAPII
jgi:hypothetical protein